MEFKKFLYFTDLAPQLSNISISELSNNKISVQWAFEKTNRSSSFFRIECQLWDDAFNSLLRIMDNRFNNCSFDNLNSTSTYRVVFLINNAVGGKKVLKNFTLTTAGKYCTFNSSSEKIYCKNKNKSIFVYKLLDLNKDNIFKRDFD